MAETPSKAELQYKKMTETPINKLIIKLAIPTTISMLVTAVYNLVDTYFVGQLGSTAATGAVGIVFSFMAILQAIGFMFGQGSGSIISRMLGNKDTASASTIASTGFFMAFGTGLLISVLGYIFRTPMVYLLGSTDTIYPYACDYFMYLLPACPFVVSSFVLNNILRYEGKANLAMIGLTVGAVLNIACDPIFMFVLDLKIAGAALATAVSQTISFCILLYMYLSGKTSSKLSVKNFTKKPSDIARICATGLPSLLRQSMGSVSTMLLNHQAKVFGDAAVAAMSVVSRISMLLFSAGLGIGQGFQPVSGFNYGAKKYGRVKEAFFFTLKVALVLLGLFATVGLILSGSIIGVFRDDPEVIEIGVPALRFQCISLYVVPIMVLSNMLLQSTGQNKSASFTSMLRNGIYYIPILYILSGTLGILGIQMTQMVADILTVATCAPIAAKFIKSMPDEGKET